MDEVDRAPRNSIVSISSQRSNLRGLLARLESREENVHKSAKQQQQQPAGSLGEYFRRGSSSTFQFNWRAPLGLLQRPKTSSAGDDQMTSFRESVIFDHTEDEETRAPFSNLRLEFLDDDDTWTFIGQ